MAHDPNTGYVDNTQLVLDLMRKANERALVKIGMKASAYARALAPQKWGNELRQSINYEVRDGVLTVGSNLNIAAYAELGTGKHYQPPPEWIENHAPKGTKVPAGIEHWIYFDREENAFKVGAPQKPDPYLRPAFENHWAEYEAIVKGEMGNG